ncbi:MarR family EPS-associated transcriptional regulator [Seongchinamella unica]|uniref:MarR family EPS-associated transcriptional regulator n=1 Tax=Seongchinamella unica TaxID=2547392 RepID=A0A4R5LQM4_9GAMM|nr:MarR family EPS-associated transcriptional regulator [Seongchinamella unica]TDG12894.1 MarR family EPS-associated transcriptional regulator [Seongchinamella unica]
MTEEAHLKIMRLLEANPGISQRDIARELGVSLGKVNYCLKALVEKGHVKAQNFKNSSNKAAYLYLLTPRGVKAKARITAAYLQRKIADYEAIKAEIEELRAEVAKRDKASR